MQEQRFKAILTVYLILTKGDAVLLVRRRETVCPEHGTIGAVGITAQEQRVVEQSAIVAEHFLEKPA